MKSLMSRIGRVAAVLSVIIVLVAGQKGQVIAASSNSLGVNPRRDYTITSGTKVSDTLNVSNLSKTDDLSITIDIIDFDAKNETGSPALLLTQKDPTRWSLKPYLTIPKAVNIPAGKSVQVPFTIAIPAKVGAGSYYGAVRYSTAGAQTGSNLNLTSSSASLIFVRVPGEANDALRLKEFGPFTPNVGGDSGNFGQLYVGAPPSYLAFRVINTGNVAEQPTGSVVIKNMFGKQVKLFEKANPYNNTVLIDQTRRYDLCLNQSVSAQKDPKNDSTVDVTKCDTPHLAPGRYTATLALVYGDNGSSSHELGSVSSFWYLPLWSIVIATVGILLIVGAVWLLVRKISGRKRNTFSSRRI